MNTRAGGVLLLIAGSIIGLSNQLQLTGAVIGTYKSALLNILSLACIISGILLVLAGESGLERLIHGKPLPGKGISGQYIPLSEIVGKGTLRSNKVELAVRNHQLFRDGRPVQGLAIQGEEVEFIAYHFTSSGAARIIEQDHELLIKNGSDPYIYFLEPMHYGGKSEKEIRHLVGTSSAEECIITKVRYPLNKVYIKVEKGKPTHYAIDGDIEPQHLLKRKGTYLLRKKLEEL